MKTLFILAIIIAIEFNLQFIGIRNEPNWAKVWDENGEIAIQEQRQETDNGWNWNLYDSEGNLITFLIFWQTPIQAINPELI